MPGHDHARPHRRCGTARSRCGAATPTPRDDFDARLRRWSRDGRPRPPRDAPPTPSPATPTPSSHAANAGRRGAVKIAFDLRDEKERDDPGNLLMPRPGFVLDVDRSTPADPVPPRRGLPPREAARRAQPGRLPGRAARRRSTTPTAPSATPCSTRSTASRCPRCCAPGMKLTIAFDDISLPLPPMRRPDIRQRVIEAVLDLAAAAGVDDVHLIAALALHRRMTEAELRHAVGDRVYDAFAPAGPASTTTTPRTPTTSPSSAPPTRARRSRSTSGRPRATCSSTSTSTSWRWTAATSRPPPAWPATAACATTTTCRRCSTAAVVHGPAQLRAAHVATGAWARCIRDAGVKIFQIETTLNNDTFGTTGPMSVLQKREWEWTAQGPGHLRRP